jgi:hypothetical protein
VITDEPIIDPAHAAELERAGTLTARVRYACDHQDPPVTTAGVRRWLATYGYPTTVKQRTFVSRLVNEWRRARGMADTGDQIALTPERLAELDAIAAGVDQVDAVDQAPVIEPVMVAPPADVTPPAPAATVPPVPTSVRPHGTGPFYLVAVICSLVSLDTAFRFFGERMGIDGLVVSGVSLERAVLCGVGELTLIACGYAMRATARRTGRPGPAQLVALALCTAAAFMAISLDGPVAGLVRAFFGPVLALVALHLALGIEVHVRHGRSNATMARVGREVRERALSRLGLGDDTRSALARTRDRAADRAARLATGHVVLFRRARLARAVRASGAALDAVQRERLLCQVVAHQNLDSLADVVRPSPWV